MKPEVFVMIPFASRTVAADMLDETGYMGVVAPASDVLVGVYESLSNQQEAQS